jgi:WhiB family redox-sensing transcriptional regulator
MVNHNDSPDYEAMAAGLDRWQRVPTGVLRDVVTGRGLCWWGLWPAQEPDWTSDWELATRLCTGCPVIEPCLELELRTAGPDTTGVWGALAEDDRRALYPIWRRRRERHDRADEEGGTRS